MFAFSCTERWGGGVLGFEQIFLSWERTNWFWWDCWSGWKTLPFSPGTWSKGFLLLFYWLFFFAAPSPSTPLQSNRLFVGKVPKSLSRAVVLKALSTFGDVESFELCPPTKSFFAFGFVIYRHEKARNRAVAQGRVKVNSKNTIFIHHVKKKIITPSSRFRKRNVGQVVVLGATEGKEKRKVVIGNCHLHWCPLLPELKLLQMDRMLKSITQWRFGLIYYFFFFCLTLGQPCQGKVSRCKCHFDWWLQLPAPLSRLSPSFWQSKWGEWWDEWWAPG